MFNFGTGATTGAAATGGWGTTGTTGAAATGGWGAAAPAAAATGGWGAAATNATSQPAGWGQAGTGVNLNLGDVKGNTRYADLEPDVKKALLFLEKRFLNEKNIIEGNKKHLDEPLPAIAKDMKVMESKLDFWMEHLERQYESVQDFRSIVNKELRSAETAYFLLKKLVSHTYEQNQEQLPSDFFWELSNTFETRMQECRQKIEELEQFLSSARNPRHYSPKMLQDIIDNQHEFFITTTSSLASIHEAVDVLREDYVALRKRFDRSYRGNPFEEAAKWRAEKSLTKVADQKLKKKQTAPALAGWNNSGTPASATGATVAATNSTGFGFGSSVPATTGTSGATGGFNFGGNTAGTPATVGATTTGGWGAPVATNTAAGGNTSGFSFGGDTSATAGGTAMAQSSGFSFGDSSKAMSGYGDLK